MSKPPKLSVVKNDETSSSGPEDEDIEVIKVILPFFPDPDNPAECEQHIKRVFDAVVKHYGEDEARRIFGPYGRQRTKREINNEQNEDLLVAYYLECIKAEKSNRKPNVHRLALRLAKERNADPIALERKLWRLIKGKHEINNRHNLRRLSLEPGNHLLRPSHARAELPDSAGAVSWPTIRSLDCTSCAPFAIPARLAAIGIRPTSIARYASSEHSALAGAFMRYLFHRQLVIKQEAFVFA